MVAYFLRWTLLKFFSSIPDEQSQQIVRQWDRITCAVINTSNEVKCPLLWEFWIYNLSWRILERVFVGSIVNIRNECLFFWVHGEWIVARNKQIAREPLRGSRRFVCPALRFIPHEPRKKDTHSLTNHSITVQNVSEAWKGRTGWDYKYDPRNSSDFWQLMLSTVSYWN